MDKDTAVALLRPQNLDASPFEPTSLEQAYTLAENLSRASLLPAAFRNKPADVFVTLLLGRDLGLTPMQALTGIYVVEGRPSVSAQTAVALVKRSTLCVYFRMIESSVEVATYETQRKGEPGPSRMTYTVDDAERAGLLTRKTWQAHPAAMLRARCTMALARDVYPDVIANVYDEDELQGTGGRDVIVLAPPPPAAAAAPARARTTQTSGGPPRADGPSPLGQAALEQGEAQSRGRRENPPVPPATKNSEQAPAAAGEVAATTKPAPTKEPPQTERPEPQANSPEDLGFRQADGDTAASLVARLNETERFAQVKALDGRARALGTVAYNEVIDIYIAAVIKSFEAAEDKAELAAITTEIGRLNKDSWLTKEQYAKAKLERDLAAKRLGG